MRIIVIGGSGHIGTYLVPRLVRAGHEVVALSRGTRTAYTDAPEWEQVRQVTADRQALEAEGTFGRTVLEQRPDVVVDLISFTLESTRALVEELRGNTEHLLHCGTLWRYGRSVRLPIREGQGTAPFGEYGIEKEAIAQHLKAETAGGGLVTTSIHPGHIVGEGWAPINPLGNLDPAVWQDLAAGRPLRVPGSGAESMHHVHADDVAQVFELAIAHRDAAAGEDFHAVAPTALSVSGYAEIAASWFGQSAAIEPISWDEFRATTAPELVEASWGHLHRNHVLSIEKGADLLGFAPRHEPDEAILESLRWLIAHEQLQMGRPLVV